MSELTFQNYQERAAETAIYPKEKGLEYTVLGLVSEAGEVAGKVKKIIRDNNGIISDENKKELLKEIGDCIWYIAAICTELDGELQLVAQQNLAKLAERKERGVLKGSGDNR